ncbi:uncharacterized protein [Rutidosis leptorrhynchoides]|uniref:uncharacterized protein n=1 Tax=Rutidosis leptorrhynchoides TaxID=125765 RepID=UPI003A9A073E
MVKISSDNFECGDGYTPDALDDYMQKFERVDRKSLHNFTMCIIDFFANVYLREPTLHDIQRLHADVPCHVNGVKYKIGYYLADEIYPTWATFVKRFSSDVDEKCSYFTRIQAAARKDVERTFEIL